MLKPKTNRVKKFIVTTAVIGPLAMSSFAFHSEQASAHAPSLSDNHHQSTQSSHKSVTPVVHRNKSNLLKSGDTGEEVRGLQSNLASDGYNIATDGVFGPKTGHAVRNFQSENELAVDGIAGPKTMAALGSSPAAEIKNQSNEAKQTKVQELTYHPDSSSNTSNVVSVAESLVGSPYKWGGTTPAGFDCSGFLDYVYGKVGKDLPRTSNDIYHAGTAVSNPSPGDLVFFDNTYGGYGNGYASHAGIYVGNGKMVHAGSNGVVESDLSISYWQDHFLGLRSY